MSNSKKKTAKYISVTEAAHMLGLSRKTVYGWTSGGVLPSVQIGGRVLIPLDDLRRALKDGRRRTQPA